MAKTLKQKLTEQASAALLKQTGRRALKHLDGKAAAIERELWTMGAVAVTLAAGVRVYRTCRPKA